MNALIQIQYQGDAQEFGWILPLPAVPEMELGTDEVFAQLINATQPKYRLVQNTGDKCEWNVFPPFAAASDSESSGNSRGDDDVLVVEDSIGPFDYAVLRADSQDEMFGWLTNNNYFIPSGTQDVVGPYIREGAYFLALKLRKGNDAGDIQPVLIRYESDLPMIPIVLTSVAANPDMGIQVWIAGSGRAIPRNYRHTVLNEEHIDWFSAGQNYNDVVIRAVDEAVDHQSFVTEYAGTSDIMQNLLVYEGRFGTRESLATFTDHVRFLQELRNRGFLWGPQLVNVLKRSFPYPSALASQGIDEESFYNNLDYFLGYYREQNPSFFQGYEFEFDAQAMTAELWERIVLPTLKANDMIMSNSHLTRLYTTLSPEEMTKDPVFSFNRTLPDVPNVHEAQLTYFCDDRVNEQSETPALLELPDGRRFYIRNQAEWSARDRTSIPYSKRIELLREEGDPRVEVDNSNRISPSETETRGCACSASDTGRDVALSMSLFGLLFAGLGLRSRKRS